jgi:hypothetical protein
MLSLLLDEMISWVVAQQVTIRRPEISIQSILRWRGGTLATQPDHVVLQAAAEDGLTLVTYDVATIQTLVREWGMAGMTHQGVVFLHQRSIPSHDLGALIRVLERFWDREHQQVWTNRVQFLRPS